MSLRSQWFTTDVNCSETTKDKIGQTIVFDRYRLLRFLDEPPPHTVLLTRDTSTDAPMVLHLIPEALGARRPKGLVRLTSTLELLRDDPLRGIPAVGSFDLTGVTPGWVEEWIPGEPLGDIVTRTKKTGRRLPFSVIVRILLRASLILSEAHHFDLVHGDLTPRRLLISGKRVGILGFPWAPLRPVPEEEASEETLAYLPPEGLGSAKLTKAWDIYQLGLIGYYALIGVRPYPDQPGKRAALLRAERGTPPPGQQRHYVPVPLQQIIMTMLSSNPAERPSSAKHVAKALKEILQVLKSGEMTYVPPEESVRIPRQYIGASEQAAPATCSESDHHSAPLIPEPSPPPSPAPKAPAHYRLGSWFLIDLELLVSLVLLVLCSILLLTTRPTLRMGPLLIVPEEPITSTRRDMAR